MSMKEARRGAACSDTFLEVAHESCHVLTLEAQRRLSFHVMYHMFLALASWFSTCVSNCSAKVYSHCTGYVRRVTHDEIADVVG
ncbi:MAG: hypothetical protein ACXWPS_07615 [Ktedonobacteraceae bacterium]